MIGRVFKGGSPVHKVEFLSKYNLKHRNTVGNPFHCNYMGNSECGDADNVSEEENFNTQDFVCFFWH